MKKTQHIKLQNISHIIVKNKLLIGLIIFAFGVRFFPPFFGVIPFGFDHARDYLAILDMILTHKPLLIGPWTSIPGLYFGPGWYYLLLPIFFLSGGHPVAPVWLMIGLVLVQIVLAWKFFGKVEALLIACCPLWLIISSGAWNPYPMTLMSIGILIVLQQVVRTKRLSIKHAIVLGLCAGLGFHFSTAFAIFYPVIIFSSLLLRRTKLQLKSVTAGIFSFLVPFSPQAIFEVRHQFLEIKAVINYLTHGREKDGLTIVKVIDVLKVTSGELKIAALPGVWTPWEMLSTLILCVGSLLIIIGVIRAIQLRKTPILWMEIALFFVIPILGFLFLHFNVWYVLGIIPVAVLLVAHSIRQLPRSVQFFICVLYLLTPLSINIRFFSELPALRQNTALLPVKLQTIDRVRQLSKGESFSSYHYVPDLYDFPYQYLYFWQAMKGLPLPVEFSYKPHEFIYVNDKQAMLAKFPASTLPAQKVFFILENPSDENLVNLWWGQQKFGAIADTQKIGDHISVIEATPQSSTH